MGSQAALAAIAALPDLRYLELANAPVNECGVPWPPFVEFAPYADLQYLEQLTYLSLGSCHDFEPSQTRRAEPLRYLSVFVFFWSTCI
jgi:hypothetical protein